MAFATVDISLDLDAVERIEHDHPDVARQLTPVTVDDHGNGWRRFYRPGQVRDLLAFDTEAEFAAYMDTASDAIARYDAALGVAPERKYWHGLHHSAGVGQFPVRGPGTEGAVMVTVHYRSADLDHVMKVEGESAELMQGFFQALAGHEALAHSRFYRDGEVLDLDEFAAAEDFERFLV
ncbi:MAG TPA: hypothetical protein VNT22_07945, partial [Baekduia sp.]|nr:hypothetical protein [Baekduia sp.]